jgi:putative transcriptional regulator
LLVALPVLRDANFERTVIYVIEHSGDGAVGVVLNRPSPLTLADPLPAWMAHATEPRVVFFGGPVGKGNAIGLAEQGGAVVNVDLHADPDELDGPVGRLRVYAGYAGWVGGQLEDEISAGAWVVVDAVADDVMTGAPEDLWSTVLRRQGGRLSAVGTFPEDPTVN